MSKKLVFYLLPNIGSVFTSHSLLTSFLCPSSQSWTLVCPSEIKCYKGTAHKLRPSLFGFHLHSLELVILLPEPNSISKLQLVPYSI
jgi:hypothetical protein